MSDNYTFLTVAGNMDQCPYFNDILFIFEAFDLYLNRIGDLFFIVYKDFFADDLRSKKPFIFVGELIFREKRRALRKFIQNCIQKRIEVKIFKS